MYHRLFIASTSNTRAPSVLAGFQKKWGMPLSLDCECTHVITCMHNHRASTICSVCVCCLNHTTPCQNTDNTQKGSSFALRVTACKEDSNTHRQTITACACMDTSCVRLNRWQITSICVKNCCVSPWLSNFSFRSDILPETVAWTCLVRPSLFKNKQDQLHVPSGHVCRFVTYAVPHEGNLLPVLVVENSWMLSFWRPLKWTRNTEKSPG